MIQTSFPALRGREQADVAIVGAGLSGLAIGSRLAKAGLRVATVEALKVASGASAGCGGCVCLTGGARYAGLQKKRGKWAAEAYFETQQAAARALQQAPVAVQPVKCRIFAREESERTALAMESELMRSFGLPVAIEESEKRLSLSVPDMFVMHMPSYLQWLLAQNLAHGVRMWENSRVIHVETDSIHTEDGSVYAPYVIIATGFPIISAPGNFALKVSQREKWRFDGQGTAEKSQIVMESKGDYLIAHTPWSTQLQLWEQKVERADAAQMALNARKLAQNKNLPLWYADVRRMEAYSMDGLPLIGACGHQTPNLFVASAYGGAGLLGSAMAAQAISGHILGLSEEGYHLYHVDRQMSWHMPYMLGKSYLTALVRDRRSPRCPHMGCPLLYDPNEKRWQCPCHGSQFDDIGRVITGPAVRDADIRDRK